MLQKLSSVSIADNTGVLTAQVIQVFQGNKTYAGLGSLVRISTRTIKKLRKTKKILARRYRKIIFKNRRRMSIVVRVVKPIVYRDGAVLRFKDNAVLLFRKRKVLRGKRFKGISTRMVGFESIIRKFIFSI